MSKIYLFITALFFSYALPALSAPWEQHIELQTPEQKAAAFLKIRSLIPSMADGAVRYGFDPVALLDNQLEIESMLQNDISYLKLKNKHNELLTYTVSEHFHDPQKSEKELNWLALQNRSAQTLAEADLQSPDQIDNEIKLILASPLFAKTQGIIVGLAQLLPNEIKKDFFSMPIEKKLQILQDQLPHEIVAAGFSPARLSWNDLTISKKEIIQRLEQATYLDEKLLGLLVFKWTQTTQLSDQNLNPSSKDFLSSLNLPQPQQKILEQFFNSNVSKLIPTKDSKSETLLTLREIPPIVGMFRGFAGNDCSTICSFPFVNSPNEFTFLIYDPHGGIKGYAQGTKVKAEGKTSFYLHTIAGPRISTSDALIVIQTFVTKVNQLGFEEVLFPPIEKVQSLINFLPVREAIKKVISDASIKIEYEDGLLRENLKNKFAISKNYDDAESNTIGFRIDKKHLARNLEIQTSKSSSLENINTQVEKTELVAMLIQMSKKFEKNKSMIAALASYIGLSEGTIKNWAGIAQNYSRLPIENLIENLDTSLRSHDVNFKPGYFKKNLSLIAHGLLQSRDLTNDLKLTESVLENLLEQREFYMVEQFLRSNPFLFSNDKLTTSFFKSFYNDIHEAEFRNSEALSLALEENPSALLGNKELKEIIFKSDKAWEVLVNFFKKNPKWRNQLSSEERNRFDLDQKKVLEFRNEMIRGLLKTTNEFEFRALIQEFNLESGRRKINLKAQEEIQKTIYLATIDHFINLQPNEMVYAYFMTLSKHLSKDAQVGRALRKLLPLALQTAKSHQINNYLVIASGLKTSQVSLKQIENLILEGLEKRTDKKNLDLPNANLFPSLIKKLNGASRCQDIFL